MRVMLLSMQLPPDPIPRPVVALLSDVLAEAHTHGQLDRLFLSIDLAGDPPNENKVVKCMTYFARLGVQHPTTAMQRVGRLLQDLMETPPLVAEVREGQRRRVRDVLAQFGMSYVQGGNIMTAHVAPTARTLQDILRARDLPAVEQEFTRALMGINANPPDAVSAAYNLLEAVCKEHIRRYNLTVPSRQDLSGVWEPVRRHLLLDPSATSHPDARQIMQGTLGIVSGIAALRTHASSAHAAPIVPSPITVDSRHARLAVNAAHSAAIFIIDSWP
jgi:hypothetical protein